MKIIQLLMEDLVFYVTCLTILIVLVILLLFMISQSDKKTQNRIEKIFEKLKKDDLIDNDRKLKPKAKLENFSPGLFSKCIYYDPELCGLSDITIEFCLLHEEGHIKEGDCGILLSLIITIVGGILIILDIIWILGCFLLFQSRYFNLELWSLLFSWGLFLVIFCVRLASPPLQLDEYISDKFASEKLKNKYGVEKPSLNLFHALDELEKFHEKKEKPGKGFFHCIKTALREYHPLISQRVANVAFRVDKKISLENSPKK